MSVLLPFSPPPRSCKPHGLLSPCNVANVAEELDFLFQFNLNLDLKTDTRFRSWETFKHVWNYSGMRMYFFNCKFYEL